MKEKKYKYEHVSIISEKLSKEEIVNEIKKYDNYFKENNIQIDSFENIGLKKLAYNIKGNEKGTYFIYNICADGEAIARFEDFVRKNENIIKFIDIKKEEQEETELDEEDEEEIC